MGREKGVGALELVVGPMDVGYDGVLVKGGKLSLSISLLWWGMDLVFFILSYFCVQLIRRLVFLMC